MTELQIIGKTIKDLRERAKWKQDDLARNLKVSRNYISAIERGIKTPSHKLLSSIIDMLAKSIIEGKEIKKKLFDLLTKIKVPDEIKRELGIDRPKSKVVSYYVSPVFIERLKKDINNPEVPTAVKEAINIEDIERGYINLTRTEVIRLARMLNQPIDTYLLLADQLPDEFRNILKNESVIGLMRSVNELKEEEINEVLNAIENVLKIYIKRTKVGG